MSNFRNPFDEFEDDHVINIADTNEQYKPVNNKYNNKVIGFDPSLQPQEQLSSSQLQVNKQQPVSVVSPHFDGEETIFMRKGDQFASKQVLNQNGDPPLLQDIGIDLQLVTEKMISILKFQRPQHRYIEQPDLIGPILIGFMYGLLLLLSGKVHFGDIYALFIMGNFLIYFLFNFMSQTKILSLYSIMSTLGYCLLPMLIVGIFGIIVTLKNVLGICLSLGLACWCAYGAAGFIEIQMEVTGQGRKALVVYPLYLYYVSFAMITIF